MSLKVLVPLDGSAVTFDALEGALTLLKGRAGLKLTLFNVINQGFDDAPEDVVDLFDEDEDDEVFPNEEAGRRMLQKAVAICDKHDVEATTEVVQGKVNKMILDACKRHDLLVMHHLERGQLKETLRGSQTEKLARHATIPVLLV